jgi:hypothetical protein
LWMTSNIDEFVVYVSNPNGGSDQYAYNDTIISPFDIPSVFQSGLVFELKTNNNSNQNSYTLKDSQGSIIISQAGLSPNTVYRDTVYLVNDCYTISLLDAGDDGLTFWANPSQGSGYFRVRDAITGSVVRNFNSDFGDNIYHQFTVGYALPVEEISGDITNLSVYPNPAGNMFTVEFSLPDNSEAIIHLRDITGREIFTERLLVNQEVEKFTMDSGSLEDGIYFITVQSGSQQLMRKLVITK